MTIHKAYKFRIYPNNNQQQLIQKTFGCCRFVFNFALNNHKKSEEMIWEKTQKLVENGTLTKNNWKSKFFNRFEASKMLPELKTNYEWLKEVDSNALINEMIHLDHAYKRYYSQRKSGIQSGKPRFKHKNSQKSYSTKPASIDAKATIENGKYRWETHLVSYENSTIKIPKLGWVKTRLHTKMDCIRIYSMTISQDPSGKYYCALGVEQTIKAKEISNDEKRSIGIALSAKPMMSLSDGTFFEKKTDFTQLENKIKKNQKILSRMTPDSNRYNKQRQKIAKLHEKIRLKRNYELHCASKQIVNNYDEVILTIAESKTDINSIGLYQLSEMIRYKSEWQNKSVEKIQITNELIQTCSTCGVMNQKQISKDKDNWYCSSCETEHNMLTNIAKNMSFYTKKGECRTCK
ncbi:MAG: RNA-guided endonuclease TnpB family protein [Culicoidibacterales bacterium]